MRPHCETSGQGGSKDACTSRDGALFCDGQYVDYGDNLQACIDALNTEISAHVMGKAEAPSSRTGSACNASAKAQGRVQVLGLEPGRVCAGGHTDPARSGRLR
jgi:hypothetical protein